MSASMSAFVRASLSQAPFFRKMDGAALDELGSCGRQVQVGAGDVVCREGEPGEALYIVGTGRLEARQSRHPDAVLRTFRRGDIFGEIALVCDTTRTATVHALRDCELWRIDRAEFDRLLQTSAVCASGIVRVLAERVRSASPAEELPPREPRTVAAISPGPVCGDGLREALGRALGPTCVLEVIDGDGSTSTWPQRLDEAEARGSSVVLVAADGSDWQWITFCIREADRSVILIDGRTRTDSHVLPAVPPGSDLLFTGIPAGTPLRYWLETLKPRAHHVCYDTVGPGSLDPAARRILGRSLGLVLSGGGARGLAHIGVLSEFDRTGIAIDRIGGTSMGAFVAALYAMGLPPVEIASVCRRELVDRNPFDDFTTPRVSGGEGSKAPEMLERVFGDVGIEELPVPFYCVSADLRRADTVVHRFGPLAEAVASSMSLPGLAPPVASGDRLLVDGGVLDDLPVRAMHESGEGPIVAVDVTVGPMSGGGSPSTAETVTAASMLGSRRSTAEQVRLATRVLRPDVGTVGLLEFGRIDALVEAGRSAAEKTLSEGRL